MTAVAFIGLGNMGDPMSARLLAAGHRVRGFDVDAGARERAGVPVASSAAEAARGAEVTILMLPSSAIVRAVLVEQGVLDALGPASLLIDMSSSEPAETQALARAVAGHGARMLDAPVSGGVAGARAGELAIMLGGAAADVEAARPLLELLGSKLFHVGPAGAGHAVKALNNLLSATSLLATSEALLAARRFGLDPETVLDAINQSSGRSWSTQQKFPRFVLPGTFDSGFALRLMAKDVGIATALARELGVPATLGERTLAAWTAAAEALEPGADHTEIARWVESR